MSFSSGGWEDQARHSNCESSSEHAIWMSVVNNKSMYVVSGVDCPYSLENAIGNVVNGYKMIQPAIPDALRDVS